MRKTAGAAALILPLALLAGCAKPEAPENTHAAEAPRADPAATLLTSLTVPKQAGPYAPVDECGTQGVIGEFRLKLARAVVERDADALVALAAPDILLDFGGGEGREELRTRLDHPDYRLWQALENLLPLGCAVNQQGGMTMPWYFAQDFGDRDSFMLLIVRGEGVPLLAEPRKDAKPLGNLSWNAVELQDSTDEDSDFAKVDNYQGTQGYVAWDKLRALIDYRLLAEERDDGWALTAFVAGD